MLVLHINQGRKLIKWFFIFLFQRREDLPVFAVYFKCSDAFEITAPVQVLIPPSLIFSQVGFGLVVTHNHPSKLGMFGHIRLANLTETLTFLCSASRGPVTKVFVHLIPLKYASFTTCQAGSLSPPFTKRLGILARPVWPAVALYSRVDGRCFFNPDYVQFLGGDSGGWSV